jgi:hypothetical protein
MITTAPITHSPQQATDERRPETPQADRTPASRPPTFSERIAEFAPLVLARAFYGPPVIFVLGPWLLLVVLLIPPAALLITLVLVLLVAAAALVALAALLASPYLLVRHLRAEHPARSGWVPAPAAGHPSPEAPYASSPVGQHIPTTR